MQKPSLFVGSSTEGLEIARALGVQLTDDAEVTVWNEGVFQPSVGALEALVNALDRFDFAALILSPDDLIIARELTNITPRDNVMFELGLFMGRLGRARTFAITPRAGIRLPSDLAGVTVLPYDGDRRDGNLVAALSSAAFRIRDSMRDLGMADARGLSRLRVATSDVEDLTQRLLSLVNVQASSRKLEIRVFLDHFGRSLSETEREGLRADLAALEKETGMPPREPRQ